MCQHNPSRSALGVAWKSLLSITRILAGQTPVPLAVGYCRMPKHGLTYGREAVQASAVGR